VTAKRRPTPRESRPPHEPTSLCARSTASGAAWSVVHAPRRRAFALSYFAIYRVRVEVCAYTASSLSSFACGVSSCTNPAARRAGWHPRHSAERDL
jgi:hypothetical protein